MVSSFLWREATKAYLLEQYPDRNTSLLDIGAGTGKYGKMFQDHYDNLYAIEAWKDHIEPLKNLYSKVFEVNVLDFDWSLIDYKVDIVILGDMLEHLTYEDALKVLEKCFKYADEVLVAVPYELPQHTLYGNELEIHLQPDLTPENMPQRYPQLNTLFVYYIPNNPFKGIGVYTKRKPDPSKVQIEIYR